MRLTMQEFWDAHAEWSRATFGSDEDRGPIGPLRHLEKEAREAYEEESGSIKQHEEIVDCLFLVIDAARRSGMTLQTLLDGAAVKLAINKARKWQKPADDMPIEHVRGEPHP